MGGFRIAAQVKLDDDGGVARRGREAKLCMYPCTMVPWRGSHSSHPAPLPVVYYVDLVLTHPTCRYVVFISTTEIVSDLLVDEGVPRVGAAAASMTVDTSNPKGWGVRSGTNEWWAGDERTNFHLMLSVAGGVGVCVVIFSYRILVRRKRCDKVQRRVRGRVHEYELAWGEFEWFQW